jgi:hypothetical protein
MVAPAQAVDAAAAMDPTDAASAGSAENNSKRQQVRDPLAAKIGVVSAPPGHLTDFRFVLTTCREFSGTEGEPDVVAGNDHHEPLGGNHMIGDLSAAVAEYQLRGWALVPILAGAKLAGHQGMAKSTVQRRGFPAWWQRRRDPRRQIRQPRRY